MGGGSLGPEVVGDSEWKGKEYVGESGGRTKGRRTLRERGSRDGPVENGWGPDRESHCMSLWGVSFRPGVRYWTTERYEGLLSYLGLNLKSTPLHKIKTKGLTFNAL